jgi:ParB-like chromosome segregation protein Spo0J
MWIETRKPKRIRIDNIHLDPVTLASYETPEQRKRIGLMADSLKEKGQLQPIIVNLDLTIIWRGHTRYLGAKKLNWQFIEAIIMSDKEWNDYIESNSAQV